MNAIAMNWPIKQRELVNGLFDSTRWNNVCFRDDDIVIATWSKSGTTLTQQIVGQLIFNGDPNVDGPSLSPWMDFIIATDAVDIVERQSHRRFMKTHLPVESLIISPKAKYIYIGRDARDVIWSFHNHVMGMTAEARTNLTEAAKGMRVVPDPNPNIRAFYHDFLDGGIIENNPFWSSVQGWWNIRQLPNVLFLHFANLIADLPGQVRRIADFLEIPIDDTQLATVVQHCSLTHMRKLIAKAEPMQFFQDGANTFIYKGTNGRWRDVLSQAEIDMCDAIAARELTSDCAEWLRTGVM